MAATRIPSISATLIWSVSFQQHSSLLSSYRPNSNLSCYLWSFTNVNCNGQGQKRMLLVGIIYFGSNDKLQGISLVDGLSKSHSAH
ncbi:hypothetical protein BC941DRAFT_470417 [Chlamydoabsidia padenii]|nr:hypothetical protein BC941DRAFT_470417 [Chlamydoabsidia padenii]